MGVFKKLFLCNLIFNSYFLKFHPRHYKNIIFAFRNHRFGTHGFGTFKILKNEILQ